MSESLVGVTGASGRLGRLVIEELLNRGVPASKIVAAARSPEKVADLTARGVLARQADYTAPESLDAAFAGVGKLLLVSSNQVGRRIPQHENVVKAARKAGVGLLAYTSFPKADTAGMLIAAEHKATEEIIRDSGLPFVFLRNSWYVENYTDALPQTLERGAIIGCAGAGRVSAATRADFAAGAAAVLTGAGHENMVYELGGDQAFTLGELAAEISERSGRKVVYRDMSFDAYVEAVRGAGLPEPIARIIADADLGIARGDLLVESGALRRLIGRPTVTLADALASVLNK